MAMEIESKYAVVSKSPAELYMAFTDMRNFLQFLPEDRKEGVEADFDSISATVQGFNLGVRVNERIPYSSINFKDNGSPFPFSFTMHFDPVPGADPSKTDLHIELSAEVNMMMRMLLGSKLKEAVDKVVDSLSAASEGRMPEGMSQEQIDELKKKYNI